MAQYMSSPHFKELCEECKRRHAEWVADEEKAKGKAEEAGVEMFGGALSYNSTDRYSYVWPVPGGS